MKLIDYLTREEQFIYNTIEHDWKLCKKGKDKETLEKMLDELVLRSVKRYRKLNGIVQQK